MYDLNRLIDCFELLSEIFSDGHLTIMRFTTGWKACFGTPDLDTGRGRTQVEALKTYKTLSEAIFQAIKQKQFVEDEHGNTNNS